ncbi:hypothetical protein C2E23DRAFT_812595 [Lenzites betulinus]|nr:hypothetical protein C2E23DRAFT_812595 [Lenzites betulinus]
MTKRLSHYQGTTAVPTGAPRSSENIPKALSTTAATIRSQITTIVDTFFETHDTDDAEEAFDAIPSRYHSRLIDALVSHAVESPNSRDAVLLESVFSRVVFTGACAPSAWEAGFVPTATTLCEIVMEKPSALVRFMRMFNAAGLDRDGDRAARVLLRIGQGW